MQAYVYKCQRKDDTYVYLAERDAFDVLPAPLKASLGSLQLVLEVALTDDRRLARADAAQVRAELCSRGFYLQVPPSVTSLMPRHND